MLPLFASSELNNLLQLELSEGLYPTPEDALLAGLKVLRESREFQLDIFDRMASLNDGRATVLDGDDALGTFFDAIDGEVDDELRAEPQRKP